MKTCANCHHTMDDSYVFCPYCGHKWEAVYPQCGYRNIPADANFCPKCGSKWNGQETGNENQQNILKKDLSESITRLIENMVKVEGGTFIMGATPEQGNDAKQNEKPAHQVTLSSFSISRYLITVEQWCDVMDDDDLFESLEHIANDDGLMPMTGLSWDMCQDFINQLNKLTGLKFRLPTEAEWEYAARGGRMSHGFKYAGSDDCETVAFIGGSVQYPGQKRPNELGLFDMSGNVAEFCDDYYKDYDSSSYVNPRVSHGYLRVIRGAASIDHSRVSWRESVHQDWCFEDVGFRLVL